MKSRISLLAVLGLAGAADRADAQQYVVAPGRTVVVAPAASAVAGGTYYAHPTRRMSRRPGRYTVMRPGYVGRQPLTFAPYSDLYNPRAPMPQTYFYPRNPR